MDATMKERSDMWRWLLVCRGWLAEGWLAGLLTTGLVMCVASGCEPRVKPGLNLQVLVIGNGVPRERATRVDVVFDRSMVNAAALGQTLQPGEAAPLRLEPPVPGTLRWREDRRLSFEPDAPLPRATAFVVTVPKGTRAPDGVGLTEDVEHRFETERLTLSTELVRDLQLPEPKSWAVPGQRLTLAFNQPVRSNAVAEFCRFRADDGALTVGVALEGATTDAPKEQLELGPSAPLRAGTAWLFGCEGLTPLEGSLPIVAFEGAAEPDGQPPSGIVGFSTYGAFEAKGLSPSGDAVSPDEVNVSVHFSTPPVWLEGTNPIQITPKPEAVSDYAYVSGSDLVTRVTGLAPHTEYHVTLPAVLSDAFGQKLPAPFTASFKTGAAAPAYALDTGSWAVEAERGAYVAWTRNVQSVEVLAASLSEEELFAVLPSLDWWDREAVDLAGARIPFERKVLQPGGEPNRYNQLLLSPSALLGGAASGSRFYYIASRSPDVLDRDEVDDAGNPLAQGWREVLLNVTNLGVTSKLSGNSGLVWVTRLSDGGAQAGAEVVVRERMGGVLWRGATGADGVATLPGRAALLAKIKHDGAEPAAAEAAGEAEGEEESGQVGELLIFVRLGDDVTFVDPDASGRFTTWNFGVQGDVVPKEMALRGFLHTDRGLYRPGDTVHVRGLARLLKLGGGLFVPPDAKAVVSVSDPSGRELSQQTLPVSRFGGFSQDFVLSEVAPLGDYRVVARLPHGEFAETFTVEEFRPATFEVELGADQKEVFAGGRLSLSSFGRYFYGAPVRSADVKLRVHSRERTVSFEGYEDYSFVHDPNRYDSTRPYGEEAFITEQSAKLNAEGRAELEIALPAEQFVSPSTLLISATVQDETNQTVSANLTLPVHQTRLYLGVDTGGWVAAENTPQTLRFVALDPAGKPLMAAATFSVAKQNWSCAWERWGYLGSYRCEAKPFVVASGEVSLNSGPLEQRVVYPGPGEYQVLLEGVDAQNKPVRASRSVWVYGSGESDWRADDSGRFAIIADKKEYRVGDTAKLIVQTPTRGANALITVERDGVLSRRQVSELGEGQAIEVPITEAFAPNAFVSVLLARGRMGEGARGLPKTSMGVVSLPVSHADKKLQVQVQTDVAEYRPGSPVTARLKVTDASGKPVQAEVSLAAADEGVLSLINFQTPDPLATFFAPWGLAVNTASQYDRLTQIPAPDQERYVTGGDGAGLPGSFRSRFRATAYWNAAVVTDAAGEATLTFDAPDNLTAFRLMAVAADAFDHFGSGERRFIVNKPLQLISALPRFATTGDRFEAAVMLTNDTGQDGVATVRFWADGAVSQDAGSAATSANVPKNTSARSRELTLTAGGRQRVAFPVIATAAGNARFRFAASMPGHEDALELNVPVQQPTQRESEALSEGATEGNVNVAVSFPEGVVPGSARLIVSVDPDGLAGIEEGLRDLVQYPYGCLEQTTSRLIPLVAARELTRSLRLPALEGSELERYIKIALAKIARHQTPLGGFGLWPGSEPDAYLTAYALWGLWLAGEAGYPLDRVVVERAIQYLRMQLGSEPRTDAHHSVMGELSSRAFGLHVMALLGEPDPAQASALAATADAMPVFGQAFLARALASAVGPAHDSVTALLSHFVGKPTSKGTGTLVEERADRELDWYFSSHVRTSAIVTDALLALRPDDARLPGLVKGLLEQRRASGGWYTTQDNLYALVALTNYAKARAGKSAGVRIARGDEVLLSERLAGDGLGRLRQIEVPVDLNDNRPLSLTATEGTLHYRVRASYLRDEAHQPAQSRGLELRRVFLDPETGAVLERATEGQMVRVQLTLSSAMEQSHVALSDWLPAGLEPINARFATVPNNLPQDDPDWYNRLWLTHRELGDERVDAFVDWLAARPGSFEYLARATTVGQFQVPAASAQKMYDPDVNARTALRRFEVVARR
jgi:alpha-2-macroglobulin